VATRKFLYVDESGLYIESLGSYETTDYSAVGGVGAAGAPVKLDASGLIAAGQIEEGRIDHDQLLNFTSNEHIDWTQDTGGTLIDSNNYVDNDTQYQSSDFDHGLLQGLNDDDHPSYILVSGARGFTGTVSGKYPTAESHLATKGYVDATAEGLKPKEAVRVATDGSALTLSTDFANGEVVDGITLATGDRILIKDQADAAENGIYTVNASGAPTRAEDFDSLTPIDEINGAYVPVQEGTDNEGKFYVQTGSVSSFPGDDVNFTYFNSVANLSGGDGITIATNVVSADLAADSGLKFVTGEIAIEASDIAGQGLVDDGSDNLAIDWATNASDIKAWSASSLSSTENGYGATLIGIEDTGAYFDGSNVETALQEIGLQLSAGIGGITYTVGTGGVTVGDAVYVSGNDTILPYSNILINQAVIGLAVETKAQTEQVRVAANDTLLASVVTGAAAGTKYFWNGSGWQTTLPNTSGAYVWLGGVAKNDTDIHVEVIFIKKNN